jgi:hypothetical protein
MFFSDATQSVVTNDIIDDDTDGSLASCHLPNVDISKSAAFARLESELASAQKALKLKEEEVDRLSKIREEVGTSHRLTRLKNWLFIKMQ